MPHEKEEKSKGRTYTRRREGVKKITTMKKTNSAAFFQQANKTKNRNNVYVYELAPIVN